ncbi:hypothetical protein BJX76DRAFT_361288 [Aspergillus varians]
MQVLCSIVKKILDGVDNALSPRTEKWRELINNAAFRETGSSLSLAKSRLDVTGDHLSYLQSDPAYMRRHLKILFATEIFRKTTEAQNRVLLGQRILAEVKSHHWWWRVEIECRHVANVRNRFRDSIYPGTALPKPYDRALGLQRHWATTLDAKSCDSVGTFTLTRKTPPNSQQAPPEDPLIGV